QKLEKLKKELQELNDKYKSIIEQDYKKYNHNTIAQQLKYNQPLQITKEEIELKLDYLLKIICEENIEKTIIKLEIEYEKEITAYNIYQYESLNY
ncbi:32936_t:CDS:1, partial [Racocetra persica]